MKKRFALCLCLTLVLSLAACGSAQPEVTIVPTEAPAATAEPTVEPTAEPTAQPTPQPENPETEEQILNKLRRYRKPVHRFHVLDETTYYASISFSDGASVGAPELASKELEAFFYRCAGKYSGAAPDPDGKEPDTGRS